MNFIFIISSLFFIGAVLGWVLEVLYRHFLSKNNLERKWIFPGFCKGPYLPLYGIGFCLLFSFVYIARQELIHNEFLNTVIFIITMTVTMTVIEYIAGIICVYIFKQPLWNYSKEWKNYKGIICPKFSLIWAMFGVIVFCFYDIITYILEWLSKIQIFRLAKSIFIIVFVVDLIYSVLVRIKAILKNE